MKTWMFSIGVALVLGMPGPASSAAAQQVTASAAAAAVPAPAAVSASATTVEETGAADAPAPADTKRPHERRPLAPNRPGFADVSDVVGAGATQIEIGYVHERDAAGGDASRATRLPQPLVRLGLTDALEVSVASDGWTMLTAAGQPARTAGASDLVAGAKLRLLDERVAGITLAIAGNLSLPSGAAGISSERYDPAGKLAWSRGLPGGRTMSGGLNLRWLCDDGGRRFAERGASIAVGQPIGRGWGTFAELFGVFASAYDDGRRVGASTGIVKAVGANVQLDVSIIRGLTAPAADWVLGAGLVVRTVR